MKFELVILNSIEWEHLNRNKNKRIVELSNLQFGVDFHNSKELGEIENLKIGKVFFQNKCGFGFERRTIQRVQ